ncbi:alpha/beta-hydrolase, partial [Rhodotorula sp. JG-1b]
MVRLDAQGSAQRAASPPSDRPPRAKRQRTRPDLPSAADLYVDKLPGLPPDARLQLFAGNIPAASSSPTAPVASDSDAHLYFLLARNKHIPQRERLVLWLNGGPGCSSFDGSLVELGPVRVNEDETLRVVEGTAWNEYANVLFLDQPAGTGYSYANPEQVTKNDDVHELDTAAQQVVSFLANFYRIFPEFATMDTYIAGESYAGQYIPYIADAIEKTTIIGTPLKGLMMGSGWISPREQYPAYLSYLEQNELVDTNSESYNALQRTVAACERKLTHLASKGGKGMVLVSDCEQILGSMSRATSKDGKCLNTYDTREYIPCGQEWPPDMPQVTRYLRRPDVIKALHAEDGTRDGKEWSQCSAAVGARFWTPQSVPSVYLLPGLLEKMPILLFNGDADLMCAGLGVERMIENLEWNGSKGFNDSETYDWFVNDKSAGRWTTARNLTYVSVYNSSHMVPMDQPAASHDMLLRFLQVDTVHSAGSAAVIPSRIGSEVE